MNTEKNIYPFRRSEEARHEIEAGMQEYENHRRALTEEETRARFRQARVEWDEEWGGKCPYIVTEEEKTAMRPRYLPDPGYKDRYAPLPWHKRLGAWWDENWEECFEGTGFSILFLTSLLLFVVILVNLGRATGWWGGVW